MNKEGGGPAEKITMEFSLMFADIVNSVLSYNEEDRKCLQKHIVKTKNREQLLRIIKTYLKDPYCNYEFKPR